MREDELQKLIVRMRQGDRAAEERVFQDLLVRFRAIAQRRLWDDEVAEDAAQDACLTVCQKLREGSTPDHFLPWVHTILRYKIGDRLKERERQRRMLNEKRATSTGQVHRGDSALRRQLLDCLKKLVQANQRYARVLAMAFQGIKADTASRKMQVNRNNYYVILNRARDTLRACLETGTV